MRRMTDVASIIALQQDDLCLGCRHADLCVFLEAGQQLSRLSPATTFRLCESTGSC